jgi:hypothetical protein
MHASPWSWTSGVARGLAWLLLAAACGSGFGPRPDGVTRPAATAGRVIDLARSRNVGSETDAAELSGRAFEAVLAGLDPETRCAAQRATLTSRRPALFSRLRAGDFRFVHEAAAQCTGSRLSEAAADALALDAIVKAFDRHSAFVPETQLSALREEIHGVLPEAQQARGLLIERGAERVALIVLPAYYLQSGGRSATRDVRLIAEQLAREGADRLVLDLRGNRGGVIAEAVRLAAALGCPSPLGHAQRAGGAREDLVSTPRENAYRGPLTLWIDGGTAGVAELFAAAMQDHGRARLIGRRTLGHGSAQTLVLLRSPRGTAEGAVRITDRYFFRPSGAAIEGRGVEPDRALPPGAEASDDTYLELTLRPEVEALAPPANQ